jgi:hypothetical protein
LAPVVALAEREEREEPSVDDVADLDDLVRDGVRAAVDAAAAPGLRSREDDAPEIVEQDLTERGEARRRIDELRQDRRLAEGRRRREPDARRELDLGHDRAVAIVRRIVEGHRRVRADGEGDLPRVVQIGRILRADAELLDGRPRVVPELERRVPDEDPAREVEDRIRVLELRGDLARLVQVELDVVVVDAAAVLVEALHAEDRALEEASVAVRERAVEELAVTRERDVAPRRGLERVVGKEPTLVDREPRVDPGKRRIESRPVDAAIGDAAREAIRRPGDVARVVDLDVLEVRESEGREVDPFEPVARAREEMVVAGADLVPGEDDEARIRDVRRDAGVEEAEAIDELESDLVEMLRGGGRGDREQARQGEQAEAAEGTAGSGEQSGRAHGVDLLGFGDEPQFRPGRSKLP